MTEGRREFTTEQLAGWVYDHEYDPNGADALEGDDAAKWYEDNPFPADTFPHYYADDYGPTIAALCREVLELRELVVANAYIAAATAATADRVRQLDSNTRNAEFLEKLEPK